MADWYSPEYWANKTNSTVIAIACAIVEGSGGNPDNTVVFEGPAPIWTDYISEAQAVLQRTAIVLRARGFFGAAAFLDGAVPHAR